MDLWFGSFPPYKLEKLYLLSQLNENILVVYTPLGLTVFPLN